MAGAIEAKNVDRPFITSHPKMDHLKEIIMDHFEKSGESTRVMYRDPVVEICNMLMRYWPQIKPMSFVGQATTSMGFDNVPGTSKGTKGFTQKQQLQAIRGFREGGYNVLVSTCVGEEGLDIGEVDLIICYDAPHSSPLRLVQRMGRTGRKREGRVVTLVTQDWEEHKHKLGLRQKNTIVKSLMNSKMLANVLCRNNPRVLPPGVTPQCHMMPMIMPTEEEDDKKVKKGKGKGGKSKNPSKTKKSKGTTMADNGNGEEDEAHRAAGNHAICQAIRGLLRLREQSPGSRFRILALSATPGRNIPSVANVVNTLRISKLELRDEQSPDVAPYTHQRNIETVVVPIGPELSETRNEFLKILSARANFRNNSQGFSFHDRGLIEGDFALAITLSHALGLLLTHGQRTFMNFLQGTLDGDRGTQILKSKLNSDLFLPPLLSNLKKKFGAADSMLQPAPDVSLSEVTNKV
ncbi:hypothetical protein J437_LFUL000224 [Ladona fulva]|uniref:Helicase C-terminal domain-containing protein n=1 Tax=Ladona fulva TaxID=123851 RepID=A0A8K0JW23_LADFU|nr:hypothetical protein J437_LFUL000224 [Ladona fulva]